MTVVLLYGKALLRAWNDTYTVFPEMMFGHRHDLRVSSELHKEVLNCILFVEIRLLQCFQSR